MFSLTNMSGLSPRHDEGRWLLGNEKVSHIVHVRCHVRKEHPVASAERVQAALAALGGVEAVLRAFARARLQPLAAAALRWQRVSFVDAELDHLF